MTPRDFSELREAAEAGRPKRWADDVIAALDELYELRAKSKRKRAAPVDDALFPGVDPQVIADFRAMRTKKAAAITRTSMAGLQREAERAGLTLEGAMRLCCERNWQSIRADWITESRTVKATGAAPWWTSDSLIVAKGTELGMVPNPGEGMITFKGRIQARIDGVEVPRGMSPVTAVRRDEPRRVKPEGLDLRALVGRAPGGAP